VTGAFAASPRPAHRLILSQFPPIGLFDTVATAADLATVMELVGWTNDRLVVDHIARLPQTEWMYGTPNASIVMAAFLHVALGGMRFNGPELGAWYTADDLRTAAAEVGHHLRRETVARSLATMTRTYRAYAATLLGDYLDIRGQQAKRPDVYASDRYDASQKLGEEVRASGAQDCSMTACDAGPVSTCRASPAQHRRHCADRSFRNYGAGDVAHDRRPQIVALINLLTAAPSR
jgi:hypothetical protein